MLRMAVGHSDDIDLEAALGDVFRQCDQALRGATPQAGLLLASWELDHEALLRAINERYPGIELAGSTTAGEMSSVLGFREDSVALTLFASDTVDITAGLGRDLRADPVAAARRAVEQARGRTTLPPSLCIAMSTIGGVEAGIILDALRAALGPGIPILGGGAAPRDPAGEPDGETSREFVGDELARDALAVLLFSGPLAFSYGVETGWRGVGPLATVTRAEGARVLEIDGRAATAFYEHYLRTDQAPIANPLAVFEPGRTGRFYLRTPVAFDLEAGAVSFFGAVPEGATVQITVAATEQVYDGARASMTAALAGFPADSRPDGALLFSCATRKFLLGTRAGREIDLVRDVLGESVPVGGFYCMGEIAPMSAPDLTRFHNATLVSLLLGARAT